MNDTREDKQKFADIMNALAENFGDQLSAAGLHLRWNALANFSIEQIKQAAQHIALTRKFTKMPTVADFAEFMNGGSAEDRAQVEAAKVWMALCDVGSYQNVVFDDPVTQAVIVQGFGGWQKICAETSADQQKWFYSEFSKYYGAYSRQGIRHYGELLGRFGEKTFFIGDQQKAKTVLALKGKNRKQIACAEVQNLIESIECKNN